MTPESPPADDPRAVLARKGNVTKGPRGLQQWGDEAQPEPKGPGRGRGTAARQAKPAEDEE